MADSNPFQPPVAAAPSPMRSLGLVLVGFFIGLATGCVVIPVVSIGALTALGNSISQKFEAICAENPADPSCKKPK